MGLRRKTVYLITGVKDASEHPVLSFTDKTMAERFLARLRAHLAAKPEGEPSRYWLRRNPLGKNETYYESYRLQPIPELVGSDAKKEYAPSPPTVAKMREIEKATGRTFREWFTWHVENGYSQEWLHEETGIPGHGIRRLLKQWGLKTNGYGCAHKTTGRVCVSRRLVELGVTNGAVKFRVYRKMKLGLNFDRALKAVMRESDIYGSGKDAAKNGNPAVGAQSASLNMAER